MRSTRLRGAERRWLLSAAMAVAAGAVAGCRGTSGPDRESDRVGWTAPDADLCNTRQVRGPIDSRSVGLLRVAWRSQLPAGTIAPIAIAGDTVIAAGSVPLRAGPRARIVAYRLGAR